MQTNLQGVNAGTVSNGGTTATLSAVSGTATTATATLTIAPTAKRSARTISLTALNGATGTLPFMVAPFVVSLNPTSGTRGTNVSVTLTGYSLASTTSVTLGGSVASTDRITAGSVTAASGTTPGTDTVTFPLTIPSGGTATGTMTITAVTPNGNSNSVNFTVN